MGSVMRKALFEILPKGFRWYKMESRIALPKPWESEIVLKSADSGREKFQGAGLTAAWFDEEPIGEPGHEIFKEVYARRKPGVPLNIFMTFTPLQGMSWSYRFLWDPKSPERLPGVETFLFDLHDCEVDRGGFLSPLEISTIESGYNEWERRARVHGQYTVMGGSPYFDPTAILKTMEKAEEYRKFDIRTELGPKPSIRTIKMENNPDGQFHQTRPPLKGHKYIIGVDTSGGVGRDDTVASVWDREELVEVACFTSNRMDPEEFGSRVLPAIGFLYATAEIVIEVNGEHGPSVVNSIRGKYPRLYMRQRWDALNRSSMDEYGFRTTARTRGMLLDVLSRCLRESSWLPQLQTLEQMATFVMNSDGKAEAMAGMKDDRVLAAGMALLVNFENPIPKIDIDACRITFQRGDGDWVGY